MLHPDMSYALNQARHKQLLDEAARRRLVQDSIKRSALLPRWLRRKPNRQQPDRLRIAPSLSPALESDAG
jgi:hypothetical protein